MGTFDRRSIASGSERGNGEELPGDSAGLLLSHAVAFIGKLHAEIKRLAPSLNLG